MFSITVERYFWATHRIKLSDDRMESPHSHNWMVRAKISGEKLSQIQVVADFNKVKRLLDEITIDLQADGLLENQYFKDNSATAEQVAKYIYEQLERKLPADNKIEGITVTEEPGCSAEYRTSK